MVARISLYVVAALLIAAHFLRVGILIGVALCLAAPLLFLVRRRWSLLLLQGLAFAAAAIWLWTAWQIAADARGLWPALAARGRILAAVAAISALAGILLRSSSCNRATGDR